jgi:Holliday junction resolvase
VLYLTEKGRQALGIPESPSAREGGPVHRYWKHRLAEHLRDCGYAVQEEAPIGGGHTVDLLATRDGKRIAFEIETGASDAEANVKKCLKHGFDRVVAVATSTNASDTVARKLCRQPGIDVLGAMGVLQQKSW